MNTYDPDRYIENLEEIIIKKDKIIEKLRRSSSLADISLSVLPHLSLLNHWITCALKELYPGEPAPDGSDKKSRNKTKGENEKEQSYNDVINDIISYSSIAKSLAHIALKGVWCEDRLIKPCNLNDTIILWSKRFSEHISRKAPIHLKLSLDRSLPVVKIDEPIAFRIINSIASNSIEALAERKNPIIVIRTRLKRKNAIIEVEDNGPGIPEGIESKVLYPYFTTRSHGTGKVHHGLGLHSVVKILDSIKGKLEFESVPNSSTIFRISLPIFEREEKFLDLTERSQKGIRQQ